MSTELKLHHKSLCRCCRRRLCSRTGTQFRFSETYILGRPTGRQPGESMVLRKIPVFFVRRVYSGKVMYCRHAYKSLTRAAHQPSWLIVITLNFNSTSLNATNGDQLGAAGITTPKKRKKGGNYVTRKLHVTKRLNAFFSSFWWMLSTRGWSLADSEQLSWAWFSSFLCWFIMRRLLVFMLYWVPVVLIRIKFTFALAGWSWKRLILLLTGLNVTRWNDTGKKEV